MCAYRGLSFIFSLSLFQTLLAILLLAWYHSSEAVLVYKGVLFQVLCTR